MVKRLHGLEDKVAYLDRRNADIAKITTHVEPVVDVDVAAQLIPTTAKKLRNFLRIHGAEYGPTTIYRLDANRRRRRMLRVSDIRKLRKHYLRGPGLAGLLGEQE